MLWFKSRKLLEKERLAHERAVTVEIEHHKQETAKVIAQTKKVTDNFNRLLNKNGITIKIHVAAGGKH
jgi:hypothetical protein